MPVIPEFQEAVYYLMRDGSLVFRTLPLYELDRKIVKKEWKFIEIGQDPKTFLEFLKEAYRDGAKEDDIIRIAAESRLQQQLKVKNVLSLIGIHGKEIKYQHKPVNLGKIKV